MSVNELPKKETKEAAAARGTRFPRESVYLPSGSMAWNIDAAIDDARGAAGRNEALRLDHAET